jgi:hypothetical protein
MRSRDFGVCEIWFWDEKFPRFASTRPSGSQHGAFDPSTRLRAGGGGWFGGEGRWRRLEARTGILAGYNQVYQRILENSSCLR